MGDTYAMDGNEKAIPVASATHIAVSRVATNSETPVVPASLFQFITAKYASRNTSEANSLRFAPAVLRFQIKNIAQW